MNFERKLVTGITMYPEQYEYREQIGDDLVCFSYGVSVTAFHAIIQKIHDKGDYTSEEMVTFKSFRTVNSCAAWLKEKRDAMVARLEKKRKPKWQHNHQAEEIIRLKAENADLWDALPEILKCADGELLWHYWLPTTIDDIKSKVYAVRQKYNHTSLTRPPTQ